MFTKRSNKMISLLQITVSWFLMGVEESLYAFQWINVFGFLSLFSIRFQLILSNNKYEDGKSQTLPDGFILGYRQI